MKNINEAFSQTTQILLGKKLEGIENYQEWLYSQIQGRVIEKKSKLSDNSVYVASMIFFIKMQNNVVTLNESLQLANKKIQLEQNQTLKNLFKQAAKISLTTPEIIYDKNMGTEACGCYGPTQDCYKSTFTWFCKAVAYSFWARTSEYCFGCSNIVDSKYCMRCFSCAKLTRCFEMSDCNLCSDSLFCHNCENVENSIFCFNAKGLRYAIANVQYTKEEYMRLKKIILEEINNNLAESKNPKISIFSLGKKSGAEPKSQSPFEKKELLLSKNPKNK